MPWTGLGEPGQGLGSRVRACRGKGMATCLRSHDLIGLGRAGHTRDGGRDGLADRATMPRRAGDGAPHSICTSVTCSKQWSGRHVFNTATPAWSTRLRGYGGYGGYGSYEISGVAGG